MEDFLRPYTYTNISSVHRDSLFLPFQSAGNLFLLLALLPWLLLAVLCWVGVVTTYILALSWHQWMGRCIYSFIILNYVSCIFVQMFFIKVRESSSISSLLTVFNMNQYWNDGFYDLIMCFSALAYEYGGSYWLTFKYLKGLNTWETTPPIVVYNYFLNWWVLSVNYLLRIFVSRFLRVIGW